jgi:hypothetical protein
MEELQTREVKSNRNLMAADSGERIADLEVAHDKQLAAHTEFTNLFIDDPGKFAEEDIEHEHELYRAAVAAYNACERSTLKGDNPLLRGCHQHLRAYEACRAYVQYMTKSLRILPRSA